MAYDNNPMNQMPSPPMYGYSNPMTNTVPVYNYANPGMYYGMPNYGYSNQQTVPVNQNNMQSSKSAQTPIRGRVVNSFDDIVPNEVPMDGSWSFFPRSDGQAIVAKAWKSDGTIQTNVYDVHKEEPVETNAQNSQAEIYNDILNRLDRIEKSLKQKRYYPSQPKKEGQGNE